MKWNLGEDWFCGSFLKLAARDPKGEIRIFRGFCRSQLMIMRDFFQKPPSTESYMPVITIVSSVYACFFLGLEASFQVEVAVE